MKRAKRIGWVSLVVDVAVCSHFARSIATAHLPKGSLASLAHLKASCHVDVRGHRIRLNPLDFVARVDLSQNSCLERIGESTSLGPVVTVVLNEIDELTEKWKLD